MSLVFLLLVSSHLSAVPVWAQDPLPFPRRTIVSVPRDAATIQQAIDLVPEHGAVEVSPGTYYESITFRGKAITVRSTSGAAVTTIDGSRARLPVVRFYGHEGPDSRLTGFTITGGFAWVNGGGGISCYNDDPDDQGGSATPTITDCVITRNTRYEIQTGGMGIAGDATLERCKILRNGAIAAGTDGFIGGGGVSGAPTLRWCEIRNNVANFAGGLQLRDGAVLEDCIIANNHAGPCQSQYGACPGYGGGIRACASHFPGARGIRIVRCIIKENWVEGVQNYDGSPTAFGGAYSCDCLRGATFTNCTIVRNKLGPLAEVGGMFGPFEMVNCILRGNGESRSEGPLPLVRNSNVQGGPVGNGNIDADPLFVADDGKMRLTASSPCIDAGDPALLDPDGTPSDMGAAPFLQGNSWVVNGSGVNPRCLSSASPPALGRTWTAVVDGSSFPGAREARLFVRGGALDPGQPTPAGELLIDPATPLYLFRGTTFVDGAVTFAFALPSNRSLIGLRLHAQAWIVAADGLHLSNALKLFLGEESSVAR